MNVIATQVSVISMLLVLMCQEAIHVNVTLDSQEMALSVMVSIRLLTS